MIEDPKSVVAAGYDKVSETYRPAEDPVAETHYRIWLEPILREVRAGAQVLDLGCGCGIPASRLLAERFDVTGLDLSPVQIERARALVPRARFLVGDMANVSFPDSSFDVVVSLYALIHVPVAEQRAVIRSVFRWLRKGGLSLMIVGSGEWTGTEEDWLGVKGATMYWSHMDARTYRQWFEDAGFTILDEVFVPEGKGGHQKFLLRKPGA